MSSTILKCSFSHFFKASQLKIILKGCTCPCQSAQEHRSSVSIQDTLKKIPRRCQLLGLDTVRGLDDRIIGSMRSHVQRCQGEEPHGTGIARSSLDRGHCTKS